MRRLILPGLAVAVAGALLALLVFGVTHLGENTSLDAALADGHRPLAPSANVALPVLGDKGGKETLASMRGRVIVLNVFASWCAPCKVEAPILEQEQRLLAGRRATVLGITYLDNSGDDEQFVRGEHITYPVLRDIDGNFVRSFGTDAVPETFVIDQSGHIAAIRRFQVDSAWLKQVVTPLLDGRS
jgi:peroxiredoxin